MSDSISLMVSCTQNLGPWLAGAFCHNAMEFLELRYFGHLAEDSNARRRIVEQAAEGLHVEGKQVDTDEQHKTLWRNKVNTFGPFAILLFDLADWKSSKPMIVYRSANLADYLIEQYQKKSECEQVT
ncbi:hypothetical protein I4U23_011541 [Adineta vaga]|nr:hypothetical protein I4U23_011541 [Adineta vaga]